MTQAVPIVRISGRHARPESFSEFVLAAATAPAAEKIRALLPFAASRDRQRGHRSPVSGTVFFARSERPVGMQRKLSSDRDRECRRDGSRIFAVFYLPAGKYSPEWRFADAVAAAKFSEVARARAGKVFLQSG